VAARKRIKSRTRRIDSGMNRLAVALTFLAPVPASACCDWCCPPPEPIECHIAPSTGHGPEVNVRVKPDGEIIGQLFPGATIRVQQLAPPWVFVSVLNPNGFTPAGWVWARTIAPECLQPEEPEHPIK
jgi:hypothetical protein